MQRFPVEILPEDSEQRPELVISSGGDGALLGAERDFPGIPKCPIRDRSHNPKCQEHDELRLLQELFAGALQPQHLAKIVAETSGGETLVGINDIVVSRMVQLGAIRFRIRESGRVIRAQSISDSLVACTPFGSTGYFKSITRGQFWQGLGLAFNNDMDGDSFVILPETAKIEVQLLRGPASVMADNNPRLLNLQDGDWINLSIAGSRTPVFGLEAFRCQECYLLRRNGI